MPVHVLISPDGGRGRAAKARDAIIAALQRQAEVVDLTRSNAEASLEAARSAVAQGAKRLIAIGGDGMIHLAAQAVAGSQTILGVIALGTGNDFARAFGSQPGPAVPLAERALGPGREIDLLQIGDRFVVSVLTGGFSGDVNQRANAMRFPRGQSRYTLATLRELPRLAPRPLRLTLDGVTHQFDCTLFAIANTPWFGGGMRISPSAAADDGILNITVVADVGRLELLWFFNRVFRGTHLSHPKVHTLSGAEVGIEADELALWGDGEPVGSTTASTTICRVVPAAIRVAI